ncbi:MAG: GAF domain-containing protein [Woronichinia naegeliana WA131]|uniref:GAF domain-containing protein n=1 Tax=Woronichinia naegeliana WA131 TaxID=2824559 RepID=A0A977PVQ8_9CYAN|nr:MAG: GAF domain-containing protein [Woronichinia naegeliana WA131]
MKLKGALGVPILVQDQVIAVLVFFTTQVRETDPHLVKVVSAVAQQLGLVLERKQIEVALRQQKELLENLVDQRSGNLGSIQAP